MQFKLPQGTGSVKHTRPYKTLTPNQKLVHDLVYDDVNGPLFFAENCCYVNRNGLEKYQPFDYQREMIFNMHSYKRLISLFSRQNGKCCLGKSMTYVKNKKTGEIRKLSIEEFLNMIKK